MVDPGLLMKQMLSKHFSKLGSLRKKCTYQKISNTKDGYNENTGDYSPVVVSSHPNIYFVFDEFNFTEKMAAINKEENSTIETTDKKAIIPSADLPVIPSIDDLIIDEDNTTWRIAAMSSDPLPAHYELHVKVLSYA
jgi:hypothetical protein